MKIQYSGKQAYGSNPRCPISIITKCRNLPSEIMKISLNCTNQKAKYEKKIHHNMYSNSSQAMANIQKKQASKFFLEVRIQPALQSKDRSRAKPSQLYKINPASRHSQLAKINPALQGKDSSRAQLARAQLARAQLVS